MGAKNQLESYLYNLRVSVKDTLADKIVEEDKEKILTLISEILSWLEGNQSESKETYDAKRQEVEDIANPIISKAYSSAGSSSEGDDPAGPSFTEEQTGPTVEESD